MAGKVFAVDDGDDDDNGRLIVGESTPLLLVVMVFDGWEGDGVVFDDDGGGASARVVSPLAPTGMMIFCGMFTVWRMAVLDSTLATPPPEPDPGLHSSSTRWDRLRELMLAGLPLRTMDLVGLLLLTTMNDSPALPSTMTTFASSAISRPLLELLKSDFFR